MCAMRVGLDGVVHRVVAVAEVPAVDVVHVPVAIIVEPVGGLVVARSIHARLARVEPLPSLKVGVREVDAVIDHGHDDLRVPECDGGGLRSIYVHVRGPRGAAYCLATVLQTPKLAEPLLIGVATCEALVVRLCVLDIGALVQGAHGRLRRASLHPDHLCADEPEPVHLLQLLLTPDVLLRLSAGVGLELHDDPIRMRLPTLQALGGCLSAHQVTPAVISVRCASRAVSKDAY